MIENLNYNKKVGIITYQHRHLKTEQIIMNLIIQGYHLKVFALPFVQRKKRKVFFLHRPNQNEGVDVQLVCHKYNIEYKKCESDIDIGDECDEYLITGAGILSKEVVDNKKIINCHPGIIPISRGLDAFKWSIYHMRPIGNTLHYIDKNVDKGKIISIITTPVFETDTLETFARRHYEIEIRMLSEYRYFIDNPYNSYKDAKVYEATMRMPYNIEVEMFHMFEKYKELYVR